MAGIHSDYFVRKHILGQLASWGLAHSLLNCIVTAQHSDKEIKLKTVVEVIYTADLLNSLLSDAREVYKVLLPHASFPALINVTTEQVHSGE